MCVNPDRDKLRMYGGRREISCRFAFIRCFAPCGFRCHFLCCGDIHDSHIGIIDVDGLGAPAVFLFRLVDNRTCHHRSGGRAPDSLPHRLSAVLSECRFSIPAPESHRSVASLTPFGEVVAEAYPIRTVIQLSGRLFALTLINWVNEVNFVNFPQTTKRAGTQHIKSAGENLSPYL